MFRLVHVIAGADLDTIGAAAYQGMRAWNPTFVSPSN
jgi:hypothetical protein